MLWKTQEEVPLEEKASLVRCIFHTSKCHNLRVPSNTLLRYWPYSRYIPLEITTYERNTFSYGLSTNIYWCVLLPFFSLLHSHLHPNSKFTKCASSFFFSLLHVVFWPSTKLRKGILLLWTHNKYEPILGPFLFFMKGNYGWEIL